MTSRQNRGQKYTEIRAHHILSARHSAPTSDVEYNEEEECEQADGDQEPDRATRQQVEEPPRAEVHGADDEVEDGSGGEDAHDGDENGKALDTQGEQDDHRHGQGAERDGDRRVHQGVKLVASAMALAELTVVEHLVDGAFGAGVLAGGKKRLGQKDLCMRVHSIFAFSEAVMRGCKYSYISA